MQRHVHTHTHTHTHTHSHKHTTFLNYIILQIKGVHAPTCAHTDTLHIFYTNVLPLNKQPSHGVIQDKTYT